MFPERLQDGGHGSKDLFRIGLVVGPRPIEEHGAVNLSCLLRMDLQEIIRDLLCPWEYVEVHRSLLFPEEGAVDPQRCDNGLDGSRGCGQDGTDLPERFRPEVGQGPDRSIGRDDEITGQRAGQTMFYRK